MYLQHLWASTALIPSTNSCLFIGFTSLRMYSFSSCLYRITIGRLGWSAPPIDASPGIEILCSPRGVLRIIVLHKAMCVWRRKLLLQEWNQSQFKNFNEQRSSHDTFKYTDSCSSLLADSTPNMHLDGMFWSRLRTRLFSILSITETSVIFKLNSSFVTPNNIIKTVMKVSLCP